MMVTRGRPGHRLQTTYQHRRMEHAAEAAEARREVDDAHRAARAVDQRFRALRCWYGSADGRTPVLPETTASMKAALRVVAAQQGVEHRIAVEAN